MFRGYYLVLGMHWRPIPARTPALPEGRVNASLDNIGRTPMASEKKCRMTFGVPRGNIGVKKKNENMPPLQLLLKLKNKSPVVLLGLICSLDSL